MRQIMSCALQPTQVSARCASPASDVAKCDHATHDRKRGRKQRKCDWAISRSRSGLGSALRDGASLD
jgi:hypothetical protein